MAVGSCRTDAPQRWRAPVLDYTAVELDLVEVRPDIVILEVAVNAAHCVRFSPRQRTLPHLVGERDEFPFHALRLVVETHLQLEEAAITVVALRVVARLRVVSEQVPVGDVTGGAADLGEQLLALPHLVGDLPAGRGGVVEQIPLGYIKIALGDFLAVAIAIGVVEADAGRPALQTAILAGGGHALKRAG